VNKGGGGKKKEKGKKIPFRSPFQGPREKREGFVQAKAQGKGVREKREGKMVGQHRTDCRVQGKEGDPKRIGERKRAKDKVALQGKRKCAAQGER